VIPRGGVVAIHEGNDCQVEKGDTIARIGIEGLPEIIPRLIFVAFIQKREAHVAEDKRLGTGGKAREAKEREPAKPGALMQDSKESFEVFEGLIPATAFKVPPSGKQVLPEETLYGAG